MRGTLTHRLTVAILTAFFFLPGSTVFAFTSYDGRFQVAFPAEPQYSKSQLGEKNDPRKVQHQYASNTPEGSLMVSYQDNPNLVGASQEQLSAALKLGRDGLLRAFGGETQHDEAVQLAEKYPGRELIVTIPAAGGLAHCRMYLVNQRLYQVMVIGRPDFVTQHATKFFDSFQLLEKP